MINNQFGTIVAMTHILLPFMILPLYSVMKTIPKDYVRAAKSLGANNFISFWRIYFPQSIPGIGAGSIFHPGVKIGNNCVVGMGSIVMNNLKNNTKLITINRTQQIKNEIK